MSDENNVLGESLEIPKLGELIDSFKAAEQNWSNTASLFPGINYASINQGLLTEALDVEPLIPKGYFEKTQEYQKKSLEMLQAINQNTANLYSVIELIKNSNDKQDEVIELLSHIFLLAKAKSKEEADGLFKKLIKSINDTADTAESIIKLTGWATAVYNMVLPFIQQ